MRRDVRIGLVLRYAADCDEPFVRDNCQHHLIVAYGGGDDALRFGGDLDDAVQTLDLSRPAEVCWIDDAVHALQLDGFGAAGGQNGG